MFSHQGLSESTNNVTEITDIDAATIRGMLHFIYAGSVPDLHQLAFRLLAAADKYEIKQLKVGCQLMQYINRL
jgi:hypothetical protein